VLQNSLTCSNAVIKATLTVLTNDYYLFIYNNNNNIFIFVYETMARTAASSRNNLTALETFERLPLFRKRLVWLYYKGEETHNAEGLNGSDYTSSGTVQDYIAKDNFRYWEKVSIRLNTIISF
jgi:hypothetical protein